MKELNDKEINISRNYINKKNSDIINFPLDFRQNFLSMKDPNVLDLSVIALRIIFKIINDISWQQFDPLFQNPERKIENQMKLKLFEDDFTEIDNSYSKFIYKIKEIDSNRNYTLIKNALYILENFKKEWYSFKNSKGKTIQSLGGLISRSSISDGEIKFEVSAYWMKKLSEIQNYNIALFKTAWKLKNNKHILFYLWLLEVSPTGTRVTFEYIQTSFDFNYTDINNFVKLALKPIKKNLDKYSNYSFNYSVKNGSINIVPYYVKTIKNVDLNKKTINNQIITQRFHYWKTRHKLNQEEFLKLRFITNLNPSSFGFLNNAYTLLIKDLKNSKTKASSITGNIFMKLFQEYIISYYKSTNWGNINPNGYPMII